TRYLGHAHNRLHSWGNAEGFVLRHVNLDADHVAVHQGEQEGTAGCVCLYQAAHIDVALRDDAIERSEYPLVGFLLIQHSHLRLLRFDVSAGTPARGSPTL